MIENYISENISYLFKKEDISQDEFGEIFDVGKGLISNYINKRALPKIETIQKICKHYSITIDEFVNHKLGDEVKKKTFQFNEPPEGYAIIDLKYVDLLEKTIEDKDKIIKSYEEKLGVSNQSKQA
jgi:HTH-type transcriptional regulator/antitoxin PezA